MLDTTLFSLNGIWTIIGFLITFIIPLFFTLLIAKKRSILASIFFLPFIICLASFLIINVPFINKFLTGGNTIGNGLYLGVAYLEVPVRAFHSLVTKTFIKIAPNSDFYVNKIILSQWFGFTFYGFLWILFFIIFHSRKKKNIRKYEDDF